MNNYPILPEVSGASELDATELSKDVSFDTPVQEPIRVRRKKRDDSLGESLAWMEDAACRAEKDIALFCRTDERSIGLAKDICRVCKVSQQCLNYAIVTRQDIGVWGGLTAEERQALRRRVNRAARQVIIQARSLND